MFCCELRCWRALNVNFVPLKRYADLIKDAQASLDAVEQTIDKTHPALRQFKKRMEIVVLIEEVKTLLSRP